MSCKKKKDVLKKLSESWRSVLFKLIQFLKYKHSIQ